MSDNFGKRQADDVPATPCKRIKVLEDSHRLATSASSSNSSTTVVEASAQGNYRQQPVADFEDGFAKTVPTPIRYCSELPLQPEELLLYCLVKVSSPPGNIGFAKGLTADICLSISKAIHNVYGIHFDCANIRNYFYRSINNLTKGLGKCNGYLRWSFYCNYIEQIIAKHQTLLLNLMLNSEFSSIGNYDDLRRDLETECLSSLEMSKLSQSLAYKVSKVSANLARKFPKWKVIPDVKESKLNLFYMGNSAVNVEYQITVLSDGSYSFFFMGQPRNLNLSQNDILQKVHDKNQLNLLMKSLEKFQICPGISAENYLDQLPESNNTPVYKTTDGQPAAFVESVPGNFHQQIIRSTKCSILVQSTACCTACSQTNHYMRTLKSRSREINQTSSKHARFDYMTKDKLLEHSRQMADKIHMMQVKIKRLETYQREMSTVGSNTDSDFRNLFLQLYKGLGKIVEKHDNNTCYWDFCQSENEFKSPELLLQHINDVHIKTFNDVAPCNRQYACEWLGCNKHFGKKKLLKNHVAIEHTGSECDTFFITLLNDQAKALNTPSRQMRWHPLILKWCLRMYSKSHSVYSELRESGFLKLPSGRTLSDYKNFCSSKSGWQISVLDAMQNNFVEQKIAEVGKYGGLFYDEVKIKEGLLFDPSSWELIGFSDLEDDDNGTDNIATTSTVQRNIATHVLQFFFKSLFASFQFPCSYFLTRGVSARDLNRLFWKGVGLLHCYGFKVILSCCDGAPENRAFMVMNGCSETVSKTINPFSNLPLIFMSDPPHLIKKLRNNIYNSGHKENSSRYTRCLMLDSKNILWDHIYSVYLRDKRRHIFSTDLRSSHVHLDSLSKMRVKLAVQVLNSKVRKDMERFESDPTISTQKFICNCEKLWGVFNDDKPLSSATDSRVIDLDNVLKFFNDWKDELASKFPNKSERSSHFITWQTMFDLQVNHGYITVLT